MVRVTVQDITAPTCTSAEIKNITTTGYDVYVYGVTDNNGGTGINRVQFPTWTTANGGDDIQSNWQTNSSASGTMQADGTTWVYRVNVTDHKNEAGEYNTHIYIYDNAGNEGHSSEKDLTATVPAVNITFDYNGMKNYGSGSAATKSNFSGLVNDVFGDWRITMDGLTVGDTIKVELDYECTNLTANDGYAMSFQNHGEVNDWSHEIGRRNPINPLGTKNLTHFVCWERTLSQADIDEGKYYGTIRTDYYTGGSVTFSNFKVTRVNTQTIQKGYNSQLGTLPSISEQGYTFDGWYTEPTGGTKISSTTTTPATDTTYYAHWTPNKYTITFDYNGQKNYFTTTNNLTQTNYDGRNNFTTGGPQSDLTGLTASDVVKISFDYTYNNLTAQSGNRMVFQIYGTTNFWNAGYQRLCFLSIRNWK